MDFSEYYYVSNGCPVDAHYLIIKAISKKDAKTKGIEYWKDNDIESQKGYYVIRLDKLMNEESRDNILEIPIY